MLGGTDSHEEASCSDPGAGSPAWAWLACGGGTSTDTDTNADTSSDADTNGDATANGETITLTVGATPNPHAEILAQVKDDLAAEGIDLVVKEYSDYVVPNTAVEEGDLDANYIPAPPLHGKFNEENGTHLVSVGKIHYEPMGIYPGLTKTLEELPTALPSPCPTTPPTRLVPSSCWLLRA